MKLPCFVIKLINNCDRIFHKVYEKPLIRFLRRREGLQLDHMHADDPYPGLRRDLRYPGSNYVNPKHRINQRWSFHLN